MVLNIYNIMVKEERIVCVTGAGGYVASWLLKLLLSHGYTIHGTLRNPGDAKYAHLTKIENASEKLIIFKADLLDFDAVLAAVKGCDGVFHVASPVPQAALHNPMVEVVEPAVNGTLNVLKACSEAKVGRVVIVSSVAAISMNPNWPKHRVMDETCWSDKEYCRETNDWYRFSKTIAEAEAWEYVKKSGLNVVTVCPSVVLGPMLQHTINASSLLLINLFKGCKGLEKHLRMLVDVRDVAEALKLVYEKPEAQGRYICSAHMIKAQDLLTMLKKFYPIYFFCYAQLKEGDEELLLNLSSEKLQKLGWNYRPLEETLADSVDNYIQLGLIHPLEDF